MINDDTTSSSTSAEVSAVQLCKLPPFWPEDPDTWIEQVEAQFHLRRVTSDSTKFYYLVAALDPATARRLRDTIKSAPDGARYPALKAHLLSAFTMPESERANRLLNLRGLGDRKPSALMDEMVALLEGQTPCFIFKQIFLNQLPETLQVQMATVTYNNARNFSLEADKFWNAKIAAENNSHSINRVTSKQTYTPRQRTLPTPSTAENLCFYHAKYGSSAHKCRTPCSFSGNEKAGRH